MDDATVEIILKWKEENERVLTEVVAKLAAVDVATKATNTNLLAQGWAAINAANGWWQVAVYAGLAAVALAPLAALLLSSAVILTAFAVAGAGTLLLLGGLAAGFLLVGGAMMALGISAMGGTDPGATLEKATVKLQAAQRTAYDAQQSLSDFNRLNPGTLTLAKQLQQEDLTLAVSRAQAKLTDAQNAYNAALVNGTGPMNTLRENLETMFTTWGKQVAPMTATVLLWVNSALPGVTALGTALFDWFGARLPGVLTAISRIVQDLTPTFMQFGQFVGRTMDEVFGTRPVGLVTSMGQLFTQAVQGMVLAVQGLITNLANLTTWFIDRLPAYGPVVSQIFGGLGSMILWVAQMWGRLADWLVANWPSITATAAAAIASMNAQWIVFGPQVEKLVTQLLPIMGGLLKVIGENAGSIIPIVAALAVAFLALSTGVLAVVAAVELLINKVTILFTALQRSGLNIGINAGQGLAGIAQSFTQPGQTAGRATSSVTIHNYGQSDPEATAALTARQLRGLLAT